MQDAVKILQIIKLKLTAIYNYICNLQFKVNILNNELRTKNITFNNLILFENWIRLHLIQMKKYEMLTTLN